MCQPATFCGDGHNACWLVLSPYIIFHSHLLFDSFHLMEDSFLIKDIIGLSRTAVELDVRTNLSCCSLLISCTFYTNSLSKAINIQDS